MSAVEPAAARRGEPLPELSAVHWRAPTDEAALRRSGRIWTAWTTLQTVPFVGVSGVLIALEPLSAPVALAALAHAWIIPELYAFRGANVARPRRRVESDPGDPEKVAQGLLGDLLGHEERDLQRASGLALERGELGIWLVGEKGAVLFPPGGRRVHCFCVGVPDPELPPSDRVAHLLLALRSDEIGFATVANNAFSGAVWRLRRRVSPEMRPAIRAAASAARAERR